MPSKLALGAVVVAGLIAPISASAAYAPPVRCPIISSLRSGGISEMATCGKSGVRGNRVQFVKAINRPVENRYFLSRLAH
jgi:hypothetical protein